MKYWRSKGQDHTTSGFDDDFFDVAMKVFVVLFLSLFAVFIICTSIVIIRATVRLLS